MRSEQGAVGQVGGQQCVVVATSFTAEDVGGVRPQPPRAQGVGQRRFVDQARPSGVHQHQIRLRQLQHGLVDEHQMAWGVQGDDIATPGQLGQVHLLDPQPP